VSAYFEGNENLGYNTFSYKEKLKKKFKLYLKFVKNELQKSSMFNILSVVLERILPIINPDSRFKITWDFFILILLTLNIFYLPIKLSFDNFVLP
jgi:hypothetical protein